MLRRFLLVSLLVHLAFFGGRELVRYLEHRGDRDKVDRLLETVQLDRTLTVPNADDLTGDRSFSDADFDADSKDDERADSFRYNPRERRRSDFDHERTLRSLARTRRQASGGSSSSNQAFVMEIFLESLPKPRIPYAEVLNLTAEAAAAGVTNVTVVIELCIDERGKVVSAKALTDSGYGLEDSVTARIRELSYEPGKFDGRAVPALFREPIRLFAD